MYEECVRKVTEGKECLQIMPWASHTPYPVGRRIASLIPPAHLVSLLPFARVLARIWKLLGRGSFPELLLPFACVFAGIGKWLDCSTLPEVSREARAGQAVAGQL